MSTHHDIDAAAAIKSMSLDEKVKLLAGQDTWSTFPIERLGIPSITTSDGPHGVRGTSFFNGPKGCLLPSATAMGATFDVDLMHSMGAMLAAEAKEKGCHVLLGPTVCLQRSLLIGRGFEAFGEDPILSGLLASSYINGIQENGVAACIKHYAAHDQSTMSAEDSIRVAERTMRELHLLPFQIAVRKSSPWAFMTGYHRLNGVHGSEDPWLIETILRKEWAWDGLVMSDWFGTYSTTEAINAGLDLEMPGPSKWRDRLLIWALTCRKVKEATVNIRVRNLLNLINKVRPALEYQRGSQEEGDTSSKRSLCRKVAGDSIVLLKNEKNILPLDTAAGRTYGLIGPAVQYPGINGGGSADLRPHYSITPLEAISKVVGADKVTTAIGAHNHLFTPLLQSHNSVPGTREPGYLLEWFHENPDEAPDSKPVSTTTGTQAQMYFADGLPKAVAEGKYWLRASTTYAAPKTTTIQLGLCVLGRGRMYVDGKEAVDLFTSKPPKTMQTPMFNQASMEVTAEIEVKEGQEYQITVLLNNESIQAKAGAATAGGLRIGCCEKLDEDQALEDAVKLAKTVDVPIIVAGLNADYESEAVDRKNLDLPAKVNKLISEVLRANPNTIIVTQAGCPITMPWIKEASTLVHAWYGGQETGNGIADVLFGKANPSGRLSVTFPKRLEDTPAFLNFGKGQREIMYGEGVFIGYRYYEKLRNPPLFYFGYGLSYTTFSYSNLQVPTTVEVDADGPSLTATVDVRNTGSREGYEVVQAYIQDVDCDFDRPCKEFKAFTKVWVEVGQTVMVKLRLDKYALSYWNEEHEQWLAEQGTFRVIISSSADPADTLLSKDFELDGDFLWTGV
ncbi:hypothetical protein ACHAPT_008814 [Fusarium lateritium]